jgi:hypothetical protein
MRYPSFSIDVSYRQLAVFSADVAEPFSGWTPEQVDAGVAGRTDSVSFGTDDDGEHGIDMCVGEQFPPSAPDASRTLEVVLATSACGELEVASIAESHVVPFRAGRYRLRFEYVPGGDGRVPRVVLAFVPIVGLVGS